MTEDRDPHIPHDHRSPVAGCFRCEIGADEVAAYENVAFGPNETNRTNEDNAPNRGASKPGYVYVASSWRCPLQIAVVAALRAAKIDCYDFRNPEGGTGFAWQEVMPGYVPGSETCAVDEYLVGLQHPRAVEGYDADFAAMEKADTFVLVLPCNRSAHLELGWAVGKGKRTAVLLEDPATPELMYRMVDFLAPSLFDLLGWLGVED